MASIEQARKRKEQLRAEKRCLDCTKFLKSNSLRCASCLLRGRLKSKIRRETFINKGLCAKCGKTRPEKKISLCLSCKNKRQKQKSTINRTASNKKYNQKRAQQTEELRLKIFKHYGNVCFCCGERNHGFLQIDHIYNNGYEHRKKVGTKSGSMYRWIIKNNFPPIFQIACANCNWGRRLDGICPHQKAKQI